MTNFLDLPRELRDLVYHFMLNTTTPLPPPPSDSAPSSQQWEQPTTLFDNTPFTISIDDIFFASYTPPHTITNFLVANKQIFSEFSALIHKARQKHDLKAKLDCLVSLDHRKIQGVPMYKTIVCYFNLSRIPLVRNTWSLPVPSRQAVATLKHRWARNIPYLNTLLGAKPCRQTLKPIRTTCIETLQIDIILTSTEMCGLMGSGSTTPLHPRFTRAETQGKKVQWAICAALKKLCDSGIEGFGLPGWRSEKAGYYLVVDMLVLNVVPPMGAEEMAEGDGGGQTSQDEDRLAAAQHVADELVSLWTKIWAGADFKAKYYHGLIDRIMRVRISVDGEIMRERDLGRELERGRKERERIGRRVGW